MGAVYKNGHHYAMDEASQALVKFTIGPDLRHPAAKEALVTERGE